MGCRRRTWMTLAGVGLLCLAVVPAGYSEVGMDAMGVDPAAVLADRWGLDVRDEINRPVSRARLEADLKSAAARSAAQDAVTSTLPHASAAALLRELLPRVEAWLRGFLPSLGFSTAAAGPVPKPPKLLPLGLVFCVLTLSVAVVRSRLLTAAPAISKAPAILRC
ncbi:MAG: hypothetical protein HY924_12205 [Elusimicrobia bacterium]|nr:hypothetical protein [Elusimicrobiota bacterium]